jgi:hypothetical protein
VELTDAVAGSDVEAPAGGQAYLVAPDLDELPGQWGPLSETYRKALADERGPLQGHLADRLGRSDVRPEDVLFFDLETAGLGSSPVFLVGAMGWDAGRLIVRQFFARHYGQERAIISLFLEFAASRSVLVSFNGKSFDMPFLRARAAASGLAFDFNPLHLDLLHLGRRCWKGRGPDCRLQTLERVICGRGRTGDIPSAQIPEAYHRFVHTGDAAQIAEIIRHNLLDLLTLADLMTRLPPGPE